MIGSSIRCFQSALITSVPGNIYSTAWEAQTGSTADNLDEQHVCFYWFLFCFYCLTGLVQRCLCGIFVCSNKLETQQDNISGSPDPTPRKVFTGSTSLVRQEQISLFTSCLYPVRRRASQRCNAFLCGKLLSVLACRS